MKRFPRQAADARRLGRRGIAALEVALAAPLLLLLTLGGTDLALWVRSAFRLDEVTAQLGEIVSQCPAISDPGDFGPFFLDAQQVAGQLDITSKTGSGALIITAMGVVDGTATILWQRSAGNPMFTSRFGPPGSLPITGAYTLSGAGIAIGTEAFSAVQPWNLAALLMQGSGGAPQLYARSLFLVRSSSPTQLATLQSGKQPACVR